MPTSATGKHGHSYADTSGAPQKRMEQTDWRVAIRKIRNAQNFELVPVLVVMILVDLHMDIW